MVRSNGAVVGHAPVWARAVLPRAEDVLIVDLDGSSCDRGLPDVSHVYQEAFAGAGFSTRVVDYNCSAEFVFPEDLLFGSFKAVAVVTGNTEFDGMPNLEQSLSLMSGLTNQGTALVTMGGAMPQLWGFQEFPGSESFHSACATSTLGLENMPAPKRPLFLKSVMGLLRPSRPASYTVTGSGSDHVRTIDVRISDNTFTTSEVMVIWGDIDDLSISYPYGGHVEHAYIRTGSFRPVVMVRSALGRIYALEHSVNFTVASLPPFDNETEFDEPPVLSASISGDMVSVDVRWMMQARLGASMCTMTPSDGFTLSFKLVPEATETRPFTGTIRVSLGRVASWCSINGPTTVDGEQSTFSGATESNATLRFGVGETVHVRDTVFGGLCAGAKVVSVDVAGKAVRSSGGSVNVFPGTAGTAGMEYAAESCGGTEAAGQRVCYRMRLDSSIVAPGQELTITTTVASIGKQKHGQELE
eukprot:m51a1_g10506 hypothetical protein (471) ;mRNA; f:162418-164813